MDNLVVYEPSETQVSVYSDVNLYSQYLKMAEGLSKTELVPNSYKNKPEACLIALDIARQIGCKNPLFVMQNLYVVQGKPSWSGQYCTAIVRANFSNVQVKWYGDKDGNIDKKGCRVIATDKNGNECIGSKVTIEMAKKEGWYNKNGSKWQTMPEQMLQYRAFTFFARVHCPEKLLGLTDEYEESDIKPERSTTTEKLEEKLAEIVEYAEEEITNENR